MLRWALASLVVALALAGCGEPSREAPPAAAPGWPIPGGPLPTTIKDTFSSAPPQLLSALPTEPQATLTVPGGTGYVLVGLDLQTQGDAPLVLRIVDDAGTEVQRSDRDDPGKLVLVLGPNGGGRFELTATSEGMWDIGMVATTFPDGFQPGIPLQVSTPDQKAIEHRFYPEELRLPAAQPWRITLVDYDPHAGIENQQHNLHFPELGLRTEGKTTWGAVRVLDLPGLAAGSYAFECEFHGFQGTLVVA